MKPPDSAPAPSLPGVQIILTQPQQRALLGFLQRASLTGREVPAFNDLFALISRARPAPDPSPQSAI